MKIYEVKQELEKYVNAYDYYRKANRLNELQHIDSFRDAVADVIKRINVRYGKNVELDWPENLLFDLGTNIIEPVPQDTMDGLNYVLDNTLTEREAKVIRLRYVDGMTYEQTGREFSVTRERIRQVEQKALRKMRHPTRTKYITQGYSMMAKITECEAENKRILEQLNSINAEIKADIDKAVANKEVVRRVLDVSGKLTQEDAVAAKELMQTSATWESPILDLELSVRCYNCCCRAGYKTIGDFAGKTKDDLMKIRNLGRKSMDELIDRLAGHGIYIE